MAHPPILPTGTSFGIPWVQGEVDRTTPIALTSSDVSILIQTWPLAYWMDGSLKWTGHALAADSPLRDTFKISTDTPTEPSLPVSVSESSTEITITTGSFTAVFNTSGDVLIQSLGFDGQVKAQNGSLVVHLQNSPDEPELVGDKPSVP